MNAKLMDVKRKSMQQGFANLTIGGLSYMVILLRSSRNKIMALQPLKRFMQWFVKDDQQDVGIGLAAPLVKLGTGNSE